MEQVICGICGDPTPDTEEGNVIHGIKCPFAENGFGICPECAEYCLPE